MSVWGAAVSGIIIGGATIGAAAITANASRGGGGGMSDKKWIKRADKVSNEALQKSQREIDDLLRRVDQANTTYRTNVTAFSNDFNRLVGVAQNEFQRTSDVAIQNQQTINAEFDRRAGALPAETLQFANDWNFQNQDKFIAFANAVQAASAKSALDSAMAANPKMQPLLDQLLLNAQTDSQGVLSADVAAQVARGSAAAALGSGVQGQMRENLTLRDLGLTSVARRDASVANTSAIYTSILNPIFDRSKVDYGRIVERFLANPDAIMGIRANLLDSWKNTGIGIEDNRRIDGARLLQSRETQYAYDYGQKATMEGNIYDGSVTTYNNAANLGVQAIQGWANQKLGITSQGWANQQAAQTAAGQNSAALMSAGLNAIGTAAGAYYGANAKNTNGSTTPATTSTNVTNPSAPIGKSSGGLLLTD